VCVCACVRGRGGKRDRMVLIWQLVSNCGKGEKVIEKSDVIRKGTVREENGNYGVRVLGCDNLPDFYQVKVIGPDGI